MLPTTPGRNATQLQIIGFEDYSEQQFGASRM